MVLVSVIVMRNASAGDGVEPARGWYFGVSSGVAETEEAHFKSTQSWSYHAGYRFRVVSSEWTYAYLGRFRHDDAPDTDVQVQGVTLVAIPRYEPVAYFAVEALLGLHRWQAEAQLLSTPFGRDDGTDATFGAGVWLQVMGGAALTVRWQRFNAVSGTDISQYAMGIS